MIKTDSDLEKYDKLSGGKVCRFYLTKDQFPDRTYQDGYF